MELTRSSQHSHTSWRIFILPVVAILILGAVGLTPRIGAHDVLAPSFLVWTLLLVGWLAGLWFFSTSGRRSLSFEYQPRKQHYVQAAVQGSVFAYWGWYWPQVYESAALIFAQVAFAYAFDMLLTWTRRDKYVLGFGPFPIVFSTNLFLLFRDDWFYLQFLMIAVGLLGKEFVRWQREGKSVHIFNPSAFSLGIFSLALIATDATGITWGQEIATTLSLAPRIYLVIFLLGLVAMHFFYTTLLSAGAAMMLFALSALFFMFTGVPYFLDSEIPIAVFLGLHLLVTDPSTSPRTPSGKLMFGLLYGLGVFALYEILGLLGSPTFYDKLLCVPLLNLCVPLIDRVMQNRTKSPWISGLGLQQFTRRRNLVFMGAWAAFFASMTALGLTDGRHRGDSLPFWQQACAEGRYRACERMLLIETSSCNAGVGWACNELAVLRTEGTVVEKDGDLALNYLQLGCRSGFWDSCVNVRGLQMRTRSLEPGGLRRADPGVGDLRVLLREGGLALVDMPEQEIYARACDHGWTFACMENAR